MKVWMWLTAGLIFTAGCSMPAKIDFGRQTADAPSPVKIAEKLERRKMAAQSFALRAEGKYKSDSISGDVTANLYFDSLKSIAVQLKSIMGTMIIAGSDQEKIWYKSYKGKDKSCYIFPRTITDECSVIGGLSGIKPEIMLGFIPPETISKSDLVYSDGRWYFEDKSSAGEYAKYSFDSKSLLPQSIEIYRNARLAVSIVLPSYTALKENFKVPDVIQIQTEQDNAFIHLKADKIKLFNFTKQMKERFFSLPESDKYFRLKENCTFSPITPN
ncbi:hypothetical protein [Sedimentisphaera salicampi]|uniref:DUF4292 domain-containing protein n=1 Tax=Sedimentisphaera salicampi TaxID=1941349 RepID=A0A1W6LJI5_9BACT|nr:hypothetical protein [Sedimentisphaera salicampi]ARN55903.1 hypothetical protein STSP1_00270 [Sedimentisphaera salicampi]OXU16094.1 hypothetical protein SMSP1_00263 [Sedimentisphaera salicampi]